MAYQVYLGDICQKGSSSIAQKDLIDRNGDYPIYGASGFIKNVDFYQQEEPYIAVVKDGAGVGRVMSLPARSSIIGTMQYIFPNKGINVDYLAYVLEYMDLSRFYTGATIPHIYFKDYSKEKITVHNIDEQTAITRTLKLIDNIVSSRKLQIEKLDQLVKSQFIEMFCTQNKWADCKIEDLCLSARTGPFGSALHHDEFVDEGIFVLGIDNAVENKFSYKRMRYITPEKYEQLKRYTVHPGDVIITIMGTVGRSAVIPEDIPTAINTKHLACLTLNKQLVNPYFLCNAFQIHPDIVHQLTGQATGAIMDGLNLTKIKNVHFHCPPLGLQNEFVELYHKADKSKFAIQQSLGQLETLKKSLMQEYFG